MRKPKIYLSHNFNSSLSYTRLRPKGLYSPIRKMSNTLLLNRMDKKTQMVKARPGLHTHQHTRARSGHRFGQGSRGSPWPANCTYGWAREQGLRAGWDRLLYPPTTGKLGLEASQLKGQAVTQTGTHKTWNRGACLLGNLRGIPN